MMQIKIYQVKYTIDDKSQKDPEFDVLDNTLNPEPLRREFYLQEQVYSTLKENEHVGIFSPKFYEKTKLTGLGVRKFILDNKGYDVYLFNPFPTNAYWSYNCWDHAEMRHPGILNKTQKMFSGCFDLDINSIPRMDRSVLQYSSFWVGSKKFWDEYIKFWLPCSEFLLRDGALTEPSYFCSEFKLSYYPYILERMFSTFLLMRPDISYKSFFYNREEEEKMCDLDFLPDLYRNVRDHVDRFDQKEVRTKKEFYTIVQNYIPQLFLNRGVGKFI